MVMLTDKEYEKIEEVKFYYIQDDSTIVVRYRIKRGVWLFKKSKWENLVDLSGYPIAFNDTKDALDWMREHGVKLPL